MSLFDQLQKFEALMSERYPEQLALMNPGLDDAGIAALAEIYAPYTLTEEIETLYRWRDGGGVELFAGWKLASSAELRESRSLYVEEFEEPPLWMHLMSGNYTFVLVELCTPGIPAPDPSVWSGDTHDGGLMRVFNSLESLLATVIDLVEVDRVRFTDWGSTIDEDLPLTSRELSDVRMVHSPGAWTDYELDDGNERDRFPERDWPVTWLRSLGIGPEETELTGATTTIAELLARTSDGPATGTIVGQITGNQMGGGDIYSFEISDGTGTVQVTGTSGGTGFNPMGGTLYEIDVEIGGQSPATYSNENLDLAERAASDLGVNVQLPRISQIGVTALRLRPIGNQ